jgi:hypothetical protein
MADKGKVEAFDAGEVAAAKARIEGTPLDGANGAHVLGISGQETAGSKLAKASRDNAQKAADDQVKQDEADHATAVKQRAEAQKGPGSALADRKGPGTTTPSGKTVEAPDNIASGGNPNPEGAGESKDAQGK